MKAINTVAYPVMLVVFTFAVCFFSAKADDRKNYSSSVCLTVSGKVLNPEKKKHEKIKVYLIKENAVIDSLNTAANLVFSFQLNKNKEYSIRIVEPGFANRLVSISTRLPEKVKNNVFFEFHFDLMPYEVPVIQSNSDVYDFPIALVYYNPQKGCFDYNRKYTKEIKKLHS